ncbi:TonB-dependent receptor [Pendulispora rubella]|uniref:TonB-dependent receptor n=1 Tax=Pendulispora rubella TaxID=2741070 RepID=A0ABZ2L861_9BACT
MIAFLFALSNAHFAFAQEQNNPPAPEPPQSDPAPAQPDPAPASQPEPAKPEPAKAEPVQEVSVRGDWLGDATDKRIKSYPGARTVLDETALHKSGARSVEDALRAVPGVRVHDESGLGILPNIGIRGLSPQRSEQVLILVDGIPINVAPYGQTGLSLFPVTLESIESVDVARGGIAVRYGPNNVGGVINIHTRRIPKKLTLGVGETVHMGADGRLLSATYARAGGYVLENLGLQAQLVEEAGTGYRPRSGTRVDNVILDADWKPSKENRLTGRFQYYKADTDLPGALTPAAYESNPNQSQRPFDRFEGDTLRGSASWTLSSGDHEFTWTNFVNQSYRSFEFGSPITAGVPVTARSTSPRHFFVVGSEPRYTVVFDAAVHHKLTVGARYVHEQLGYKSDVSTFATGQYLVDNLWDFHDNALAAYVSDTLGMLDNRLEITPGVRVESLGLSYRDQQTGKGTTNVTNDVLPGISLGYRVAEPVFLYANYNKSFRPVQFTQITYGGELRPESAINYEVGTRISPIPDLTVNVTGFGIDFRDKLEFQGTNIGFRNLGRARHLGVETTVKAALSKQYAVEAGYTYLDTEQLGGKFPGNELPYASHHQLSVRARYAVRNFTWVVSGTYQSSAFSDGENTHVETPDGTKGPIPDYWLWNTQVTRQFDVGPTKVRLALAVNNLLDSRYYFRSVSYSNGRMPGQGRSAFVRLELEL